MYSQPLPRGAISSFVDLEVAVAPIAVAVNVGPTRINVCVTLVPSVVDAAS